MNRSSKEIRRQFIEFFVQRGHTFVPSSSLLPADDPTLLFANAGMNQFKDVFLGAGSRPYSRAVNTQKCIRAGGKHNDLEDVGHDTYHHTFFEMLGNWSFGDYFKREAIRWAWELLTGVWGLPVDRMYATYFKKRAGGHIETDGESRDFWRDYLPEDRILPGDLNDNFWMMGETGPCGPCTEIHFDRGVDACDGSRHPGTTCDVNVSGCGRFVELWNLVFIQFNRTEAGVLEFLPAKHVDTGMGFERICTVLQGKIDNYATDVFSPLMARIEELSGHRYGARAIAPVRLVHSGLGPLGSSDPRDVASRVIADHTRACTFAIGDGILPSNEGRGYVIRRILRRAARYGRKLNLHEPFLHQIVPVLIGQMGEVFPEIHARQKQIVEAVRQEEVSFNQTLDRGIDLFEKAAEKARTETRSELSGAVVFELYATYGFPADLTQLMAAERGLLVDMAEYYREMDRHRAISAAGGGGFKVAAVTGLPETDDSPKYTPGPLDAKVLGWVVGELFVTTGELAAGAEAAVVLDRTNFYGEQGGQVGDAGTITSPTGVFAVTDTKLVGHCVLHVGKVERGPLVAGQKVVADVSAKRMDTRRNHTATHLLNWALRAVLGEGVDQAGSVVDPGRLRFDFTAGAAVTDEQLAEVERLVNARVLADEPVVAGTMPLAEARKLPGVRAVFGEKYPDPVRVVRVGHEGKTQSAEFCGGTHLDRTSQVGLFKIVGEESVAKGVRRITAVTGREAVATVQRTDRAAGAAAAALRIPVEELPDRIAAMQKEIKDLRKARAAGGGASGALNDLAASAEVIGGVKVIVGEVDADDPEQMRSIVDQLRQKAGGPAAVMVGSRRGGRPTLVAGVAEEVVKSKGVKAGDWVKAAAAVVGGSGGGKPTMAQAGGKDPERLPEALQAAREWMRDKLG